MPDGEERITVDGHDWIVRARPGEPGVHDVDWLTGPHAYGFTCATSNRSELSRPAMEQQIRNFLSGINPATGYLD